jgi:hypothetical protein
MSVQPLTKQEVYEIICMLDETDEDSNKIANKMNCTRQQVAAVKAWKTMGKY